MLSRGGKGKIGSGIVRVSNILIMGEGRCDKPSALRLIILIWVVCVFRFCVKLQKSAQIPSYESELIFSSLKILMSHCFIAGKFRLIRCFVTFAAQLLARTRLSESLKFISKRTDWIPFETSECFCSPKMMFDRKSWKWVVAKSRFASLQPPIYPYVST